MTSPHAIGTTIGRILVRILPRPIALRLGDACTTAAARLRSRA